MPWQLGIDEAGYGPNLGPLVTAAVALRVEHIDDDCWRVLAPAVGKVGSSANVIVDDSKAVYGPAKALAKLEAVALSLTGSPTTVGEFLRSLGTLTPFVAGEPGFQADEKLPANAAAELRTVGPAFARVVPAREFNAGLDRLRLKSDVAAESVHALIRRALAELPSGEALAIHLDRQGGRVKYADYFQHATGGWVRTVAERADYAHYVADVDGRPVTLTVTPKADSHNFAVAAASMVAKYAREILMRQFNRFWTGQVPGLAVTAGYPADARRFFAAIESAVARVGLTEADVWRRK